MNYRLDEVLQGCEWLEKNYPGWVKTVDTDWLDLNNCATCVIGQLTGEAFYVALNGFPGLGNTPARLQWAEEHGFCINGDEGTMAAYRALTETWIGEILRRRQSG